MYVCMYVCMYVKQKMDFCVSVCKVSVHIYIYICTHVGATPCSLHPRPPKRPACGNLGDGCQAIGDVGELQAASGIQVASF